MVSTPANPFNVVGEAFVELAGARNNVELARLALEEANQKEHSARKNAAAALGAMIKHLSGMPTADALQGLDDFARLSDNFALGKAVLGLYTNWVNLRGDNQYPTIETDEVRYFAYIDDRVVNVLSPEPVGSLRVRQHQDMKLELSIFCRVVGPNTTKIQNVEIKPDTPTNPDEIHELLMHELDKKHSWQRVREISLDLKLLGHPDESKQAHDRAVNMAIARAEEILNNAPIHVDDFPHILAFLQYLDDQKETIHNIISHWGTRIVEDSESPEKMKVHLLNARALAFYSAEDSWQSMTEAEKGKASSNIIEEVIGTTASP